MQTATQSRAPGNTHIPNYPPQLTCETDTTTKPAQLSVGTLEVDDSADVSVSFKTAAEFGGINDITPVLTSFMKAHAGIGLDCFRALTAMKDADADATHALGMIGMVGPTGEMSKQADDKLSAMLSVLSSPA